MRRAEARAGPVAGGTYVEGRPGFLMPAEGPVAIDAAAAAGEVDDRALGALIDRALTLDAEWRARRRPRSAGPAGPSERGRVASAITAALRRRGGSFAWRGLRWTVTFDGLAHGAKDDEGRWMIPTATLVPSGGLQVDVAAQRGAGPAAGWAPARVLCEAECPGCGRPIELVRIGLVERWCDPPTRMAGGESRPRHHCGGRAGG